MLTKAQLFEAVTGKFQVVSIPDVGEIEIRPLSLADVTAMQLKQLDGIESGLEMIRLGLVNPQLDEEDLIHLKNGMPKKVFAIAEAITEISGMTKDDTFLESGGKSS